MSEATVVVVPTETPADEPQQSAVAEAAAAIALGADIAQQASAAPAAQAAEKVERTLEGLWDYITSEFERMNSRLDKIEADVTALLVTEVIEEEATEALEEAIVEVEDSVELVAETVPALEEKVEEVPEKIEESRKKRTWL